MSAVRTACLRQRRRTTRAHVPDIHSAPSARPIRRASLSDNHGRSLAREIIQPRICLDRASNLRRVGYSSSSPTPLTVCVMPLTASLTKSFTGSGIFACGAVPVMGFFSIQSVFPGPVHHAPLRPASQRSPCHQRPQFMSQPNSRRSYGPQG